MNDHYYTASEAQARLSLSKAMFFRKVHQGLIPKVVLPGMKQGVYPKRDIDALAMSMDMVFEQYDKMVFSRSTPADQIEEMNIGIHCFGRDFITPLPERIAFQQKSEYTFHSLKVLIGRKIERDITIKDALPFVRLVPFSIYIDVMATDPHLRPHMQRFYAGNMISRFVDLLFNLLANSYQITYLYTVTSTIEGDNLVKKLGFQLMEGKSVAPGRTAYKYTLDQKGIEHLSIYSQRGSLPVHLTV